jgi:hypothetical protein
MEPSRPAINEAQTNYRQNSGSQRGPDPHSPTGNSPVKGQVWENFSPAGMDLEIFYPHCIYRFGYKIASTVPVFPGIRYRPN